MQSKYFCDIGDYGKFGLLRSLGKSLGKRIGVVWYRFPDEEQSTDGSRIEYLSQPDYGDCDPELFKKLKDLYDNWHRKGTRPTFEAVQRANVLPAGTRYYASECDFWTAHPGNSKQQKDNRENARKQWISDACSRLADCPIVFLDPDNGLKDCAAYPLSRKKAGKYAYFTEVRAFLEGRDICVVIHHFDRSADHLTQMETLRTKLENEANPGGKVFALRFNAYNPRAFFILCRQSVKKQTEDWMDQFSYELFSSLFFSSLCWHKST